MSESVLCICEKQRYRPDCMDQHISFHFLGGVSATPADRCSCDDRVACVLGRVFTSKVYLPNICTPLYQIFKINVI